MSSSILVVSNKQDVFAAVTHCLDGNFHVEQTFNRGDALEMAGRNHYELILFDIELLTDVEEKKIQKEAMQVPWDLFSASEVVVLSPREMIREAVKAVKAGAADYITYPIEPAELKHVIEDLYHDIAARSELAFLRDRFWQSDSLEIMRTRNPEMKGIFDKVRSVAPTRATVLLTGETGTGKGVMARLIHRHSNRRDNQFTTVHCGAIPDTLIESELFGHEKGAFTGAVRRKLGKFEIAHGGTIFLDEIGTLTPSAQIKFLQVLQNGIFQRVGGEENINVDVRVIAATNAELEKMCDEGLFRKDLFYRLNIFPIEVPPLRKRKEDIPYLTDLFLKKLNRGENKKIHTVAPDVMESFRNYLWPGNIREMENIMERAYIMETSHILRSENLAGEVVYNGSQSGGAGPATGNHIPPLSEIRRRAVETAESAYLTELLERYQGRINHAAVSAGVTTRQIHKLMKKHAIRKDDFRDTGGSSE
jgi:DNA-binding NtrC family response regulator